VSVRDAGGRQLGVGRKRARHDAAGHPASPPFRQLSHRRYRRSCSTSRLCSSIAPIHHPPSSPHHIDAIMYDKPGAILPRNQRLAARSMPASAVFGPAARRLPLYVNASAPVSSQPGGPLEVIWLDGPFYSQSSSSFPPLQSCCVADDGNAHMLMMPSSTGRLARPRLRQPLALVRHLHSLSHSSPPPPNWRCCLSFVHFSRWRWWVCRLGRQVAWHGTAVDRPVHQRHVQGRRSPFPLLRPSHEEAEPDHCTLFLRKPSYLLFSGPGQHAPPHSRQLGSIRLRRCCRRWTMS
jgi:hypothetical protein